jgi:pimeloyl-ACP methyl ester carboxylesterase
VNEFYVFAILSLLKKDMQKIILLLICLQFITSCSKDDDEQVTFKKDFVQLSTHKLRTYSIEKNSNYLIVFESGLGDDHSVWKTQKVAEEISHSMDVVIYDRAGYGESTLDSNPRNIDRLTTELEAVVNKYANGRKVILVGHSLGGLIIRDFAIKNPNKTAGLLFVDPSHENYNQPTQEIENIVFDAFNDAYGSNFGGTKEARELIEDFAYTSSLPNLPNVPIVVLTSMKLDQANNTTDQTYGKTRQDWYDAHEQLHNGVTDFTHVETINAGHYIMLEEPHLVIDNLTLIISKLP